MTPEESSEYRAALAATVYGQPDEPHHNGTDPYADLPHTADVAEPPCAATPPLGEVADRFTPIDWHTAFNKTPVEVPWLVEDMFIAGCVYAIVAAAKAGKSLLLLDLAAALAAGRSALGRPASEPCSVLYVDLENAERDLVERLTDMGYGPDDLEQLHYFSFPSMSALDSHAGGAQLVELAQRYDAQLIILDTLSRFVTGDENSSDTYRALYRCAIAPLKAEGRTVVRLDHLGKDATRGQRGSSAKNDDVDCVWQLVVKGDDTVTLRRERQRSNHHPEWIEVTRQSDPLRHVAAHGTGDPRVAKLIADMDRIGVPLECGRKNVRAMLTQAGISAGNDVLTRAIKERKSRADRLSADRADTFTEPLFEAGVRDD